MARGRASAPTKGAVAKFSAQGPGGSPEAAMASPKAPGGGGGFLINHNAFTDARPPSAKGMKKSAGYPNFNKNP